MKVLWKFILSSIHFLEHFLFNIFYFISNSTDWPSVKDLTAQVLAVEIKFQAFQTQNLQRVSIRNKCINLQNDCITSGVILIQSIMCMCNRLLSTAFQVKNNPCRFVSPLFIWIRHIFFHFKSATFFSTSRIDAISWVCRMQMYGQGNIVKMF